MAKYPDISHWHPVNDWAKVKENCPFLISKATEGQTYIDPTLDSFVAGCESYGIPYWLYVYLRRDEEKKQAEFLTETCKNKVGKFFVGYILDIEERNDAADVQEALDYLSGLGVKTMLYTMYSQYPTYQKVIETRPDSCAWWEARYGLNKGVYHSNYPCHAGADLHQYTSKGSCPGIEGECDLNRILQKGEAWYTTPGGEAGQKGEAGIMWVVSIADVWMEETAKAVGAAYPGCKVHKVSVLDAGGVILWIASVADVWTQAQAEEMKRQLAAIGVAGVVHMVQILE